MHLVFTVAVLSMVIALYFGMSRSFGAVPWPYALLSNAILIVQFTLVHSRLRTGRGMRWLRRIVPGPYAGALSTTTYAIIYMGIAHKRDRPGHQ